MTEVQDRAMDKIRDEMAKEHDRPEIGILGEYLTERIRHGEGVAQKILQDGKTLAGAFQKIREYAKAHAKNGFCAVEGPKALAIACEYYGLTKEEQDPRQTAEKHREAQALAPDLDELLAGG